MDAQEVLDFWFLPPSDSGHGKQRAEWFRKDDAFDAAIRERFGAAIDHAIAGGLREWDAQGPRGVLARILVLDQFTRNAYRATPDSFAGDLLALNAARQLVDSGAHLALTPLERVFVYMPYMHSESALIHEQALKLFAQPGMENNLDFERRHKAIIDRFGRYPHRNAILGRTSTPEELAFLNEPGSSF